MAIEYTFHGEPPKGWDGNDVRALGAQVGNKVSVADGAASAALPAGLYKIDAITDSRVRWDSASLSDGANGTRLATDDWLVAYIKEGCKIGVSAYS